MKTRDHSMTKRNVSLFLMVSSLLVLSMACAFVAGGLTPTPTPAPPTPVPPTPVPPTPVPPTPTPTSVPPTATSTAIPPTSTPPSIPGIDEPILIENVTVEGFSGFKQKVNIRLRLLNAYVKDSLTTKISPSSPANIFLILEYWLLDSKSGASEWVARNATLTCGKDEYKVERHGIDFGNDGRLRAELLIFEAPQESDFGKCVFHLQEHAVELTTFFK